MVSTRRPGLAFATLVAILVITAAWWTLALWPASAAMPAWIMRTRAACFGTAPSGLPDAGGWILLIGEPVGMLAALAIMWGRSLRADVTRIVRYRLGRVAVALLLIGVLVGTVSAAQRVASARGMQLGGSRAESFALNPSLPPRTATIPPALALVDQHSRATTLNDVRGRWAIVTFAFGQCETMCPLIVRDVLQARLDTHASDVPMFVITLDPWRDTPARLGAMATAWSLGPDDRVLSGDVAIVNATLDAWGIARHRDEATGNIEHGSTVIVIDPNGRVARRIEGASTLVVEALSQRQLP